MSKKQKLIFRCSIFINIALAVWMGSLFIKTNFSSIQLFYTEVQHNLVELEGLIADQKDKGWEEPNLVTKKLGDAIHGLYLGIGNAKYLRTISESDRQTLEKLAASLSQYPQDKLYAFASLTEEDQQNFEALRNELRNAKFGLNITMSNDWNSFISRAKVLQESIEVPLNFK